jgi:HlyD family secretion protein
MKKLIGFVVILAAGGAGWWYYITNKPPEKPTVNYAAVSRGAIVEAVSSTGTLEPLRRYDVGSQVSGTVKEIYVDYNNIVKQGQLLAEIDPQLLQVQVDIQTANIERQKMDIANQRVQLEDQKKQFERTKSLYEKGLQNQQQYEAAELAIKTREAQIMSAEKQLVQAEANLSSAKLNVSYTKIYAPADGVVVERRVDRGQTVQASMTTPSFFVLSTPLQNLKLTALVDEAEIGRIRPGMEVRFTVDAYGRKEFRGTVDAVRLNASVNNNVVTYPVWITVPNPELELRPSMTANLRIVISTADDVIRVPNQALRFRPNAEIYTALGLTPPAPGSGGRATAANNDDNGRTSGPGARPGGQGAAAQQGQGAAAQPGEGARAGQGQGQGNRSQAGENRPSGGQGGGQSARGGGQGGRTPGTGFGGNRDMANMTPEQMAALRERFSQNRGNRGGGAGGRGGNQMQGRGGGRGGSQGNPGAQPPVVPTNAQRDADRIDELWAPVVRTESRSQVYTWNEATKDLKMMQVRLGVTDGSFSELLGVTGGELKVGDQLVTGVVLPLSQQRPNTTGNPFAPQGPQRMPGMGNPGGGGPGGGGGGNPGGGGGGGGRGGGGRGGGN